MLVQVLLMMIHTRDMVGVHLKKETTQWHLFRMVTQTLVPTAVGVGTSLIEFCSGGERLDSPFWIPHRQVGIYSQGIEWESMLGKLLRGNTGVRGVLAKPT